MKTLQTISNKEFISRLKHIYGLVDKETADILYAEKTKLQRQLEETILLKNMLRDSLDKLIMRHENLNKYCDKLESEIKVLKIEVSIRPPWVEDVY